MITTWLLLGVCLALIIAFLLAEFAGVQAFRKFPRFSSAKNYPSQPAEAVSVGDVWVTLADLARYERDVPNLKSVIVVSSVVENPSNDLARAVIDNFQQGVKYQFFVSKEGNTREGLEQYYDWFESIYKVARGAAPHGGPNAIISEKTLDDLLSISVLPLPWTGVPYVFYTYCAPVAPENTVAFRGSQNGRGIALNYQQIPAEEARTIVDLCAASSPDFREALAPGRLTETYVTSENVVSAQFGRS